MKVILAGCGFLGEAAADLFYEQGCEVLGLCATEETAACFSEKGYRVEAMDIAANPVFHSSWVGADLLVHCASSGRGGVEAYRRVYRDGLEALIRSAKPKKVVFVSSTSVYAQTDGSWVDERCAAQPSVETGKVLLETEALALAADGVVLRLAGLYGPGRSVLLRRYLDGEARLDKEGSRWINQVHRDDAAAAIVSSPQIAAGVYNVVDDSPARQREVYEWIAEACSGEMPPQREGEPLRKRGNTNKRVLNSKLKATGWRPQFPSYQQALPSLLASYRCNPTQRQAAGSLISSDPRS